MALTVLLVRHAAHARVHDTLCGRMPGVTLSAEGIRQAEALGARLRGQGPVYTSPVQRAIETAERIAPPVTDAAFEEIDFGVWVGRRFDALQDEPEWQAWNARRATARPPGGESMDEVQARAMAGLARLRAAHGQGRAIVVSHGDVIKSVLCRVLGLSMDAHLNFEIAPASISTVELWDGGGRVTGMNEAVTA